MEEVVEIGKSERSLGWEMGLSVGIEEGKDHSAERQKS